jgi:hypothetical protein
MAEIVIPMPFTFADPFKNADEKIVVVWINGYRKQNGRPVIVDWSAKRFFKYSSRSSWERFLQYGHAHHNLGILASLDDPKWRVSVGTQAPEALNANAAKKSDIVPIRRLRGVFKGKGRKMPGWALDAVPSNVVSKYLAELDRYGDLKISFCVPDASDRSFLRILRQLQVGLADHVDYALDRHRELKVVRAYANPRITLHINPELKHKENLIQSLTRSIGTPQIQMRRPENLYIVEPTKKAS